MRESCLYSHSVDHEQDKYDQSEYPNGTSGIKIEGERPTQGADNAYHQEYITGLTVFAIHPEWVFVFT